MIGIPPERCIVFEDSLSGIEAGKKAGCVVVGVATTHKKYDFPPNIPLKINNYDEVSIEILVSEIEKNLKKKNS
jgi:beta-phosphoglucomutase-like phosphatase (HAD superfamily)